MKKSDIFGVAATREEHNNQMHNLGRIFTWIALGFICALPIVYCISAGVTPNWSQLGVCVPFMAGYWAIGLIEALRRPEARVALRYPRDIRRADDGAHGEVLQDSRDTFRGMPADMPCGQSYRLRRHGEQSVHHGHSGNGGKHNFHACTV